MSERESNYQAGRFEAMSRTRDAFTGSVRERVNTRSQQLAAKKNKNQEAQTFTREQFKTKNEVISTQNKIDSKEVQSAWNTYGQMEQGFLKSEQAWQLNMQLPLAIEQKLGKAGKEQVLLAIQARKAQAEKVANANTEAVAQEQALTQQEIKLEADKLLAMAPESLLAGSLAAIAIWGINRLPIKVVYKTTAIVAILGLFLSACTTINRTSTAEVPTQTDPVAGETFSAPATVDANGTATPEGTTVAIIGTATAEAAKTQEASRANAFLEAYLAGQSVDVSQLSPSEFREFSTKLAEKKNAERGINPVLYKNEGYINPDNYMLMKYDGHPDQEETIEMYLAIAGKDSEGNLQIINEDGKIITIANSADVDWNMVVTDPNDPRIDLAHTGPINEYNGLPAIQSSMVPGDSISPMILLDKIPGAIIFDTDKGGTKQLSTYHFLKVETDQSGNPIMARKFLVFPAGGTFYLFKEGSTDMIDFNNMHEGLGTSKLNTQMIPNSVYYLHVLGNQENIYKTWIFANLNNYTGVVTDNEAATSLTGQAANEKDMIILGNGYFIKPIN